jgi:tape measure domain-containing protein
MTLVGSLELELSLNRDRFDRQLAELQNNGTNIRVKAQLDGRGLERSLQKEIDFIKRWDLGKLNIKLAPNTDKFREDVAKLSDRYTVQVGLNPDVENFNRKLQEMQSQLDCIKVDLCPDVDDFKKKLGKIANTQLDCIPVKLCADTTTLQDDIQKIKIDPINVDLKINVEDFQKKLALLEKSQVKPITVEINANTDQVNEQIKQISIDPINIDLKVNVEDFNKKLRIIEKSQITPINISIVAESSVLPKAILDDFEQVSYRVQERWKEAIAFIKAEFASLAQDAENYGYLVQKGISEGSPGPSFYTRENWKKTISDVKSSMSELGDYSDSVGKDIAGNLNKKPGKFSLFGDNSSFSDDLTKSIEKGFRNAQHKGLFQSLIGGGLGLISGLGGLMLGLGKAILSPLKMAISGAFLGIGLPLGQNIGGQIATKTPLKGISTGVSKLISGFEVIDKEIIGKMQVYETFFAEILRSGQIGKASQVAFERTTLNKHFKRLQSIQEIATIPAKNNSSKIAKAIENLLSEDKELMSLYQDFIIKTNAHRDKPLKADSKAAKLAFFPTLINEGQPKELATNIVLPMLKQLQPLLTFIQGMQSYNTSVLSQRFYNEKKPAFPILDEGENVISVLGGAQNEKGQGGRQIATSLEPILPGARILPVENLDTDNTERTKKIDDLIKQSLGQFIGPEMTDMVPTIVNALRQIVYSLDPLASSVGAAQALAHTRLAQEQGKEGSVLSFSLGGADALRYAQTAQYQQVNTNALAMAYPFLNIAGKPPAGLHSAILEQDPLSFPFKLGMNFPTQQAHVLNDSGINVSGAEVHGMHHLFKSPEFIQLLSNTTGQGIPTASPDQLSETQRRSMELQPALPHIQSSNLLMQQGKIDLTAIEKIATAIKITKEMEKKGIETEKIIAKKLGKVLEDTLAAIINFLKGKNITLPNDLSEIKGYAKYADEAIKLNKVFQSFKTSEQFSDNEAWFAGGLNVASVAERKRGVDNEFIPWAKQENLGSYKEPLLEALARLSEIQAEFIRTGGNLSQEFRDSIHLLSVPNGAEELVKLAVNTGDVLPQNQFYTEQLRLQELNAPDALKKVPATILAFNKMVESLGEVMPDANTIQSVAFGMSGASALMTNDLVYKTDLDPSGAEKIASKQEIDSYNKLQGRYSPLLYTAKPGEALVTERIKGKSLKDVLSNLVKPIQELQKELGQETDKGKQQELKRKIQEAKRTFNQEAEKLYYQLGQLGAAMHEMGVAHNDLASGNVFFTEKGITSIDLGNAVANPSDEQKFNDKITAVQRALIDQEFMGVLDPFKTINAITSGFNNPLPIPEARQINPELLSPSVPGQLIPLGSTMRSMLQEVTGKLPPLPTKNEPYLIPETIAETNINADKIVPELTTVEKEIITSLESAIEKIGTEIIGIIKNISASIEESINGKIGNITSTIDEEIISTIENATNSIVLSDKHEEKGVIEKAANSLLEKIDHAIITQINKLLKIENIGGNLTIDTHPDRQSLKELTGRDIRRLGLKALRGTNNFIGGAIGNTAGLFMPGLQTVYSGLKGAENVALGILPYGKQGKSLIQNTVLPAAAFGLATQYLPGGAGMGGALQTAAHSIIDPLSTGLGSAIAHSVTTGLTEGLTAIPMIGNALSTALGSAVTQSIASGATALGNLAINIGVPVLAGKTLLNTGKEATKSLFSGVNPNQKLLPGTELSIERQAEKLTVDLGKNLQLMSAQVQKTIASQITKPENKQLPGNAQNTKQLPPANTQNTAQIALSKVQEIDKIRAGFVGGYTSVKQAIADNDIVKALQIIKSMRDGAAYAKKELKELQSLAKAHPDIIDINQVRNVQMVVGKLTKATDEQLRNAARQVGIEWKGSIDHILQEFSKMPEVASKVGYDILGGLAEHSPGPSYLVRMAWGKTANFLEDTFNRLPKLAEKTGQAINQNLNPDISKNSRQLIKLPGKNYDQEKAALNNQIKLAQEEMQRRILIAQQHLLEQGFNANYNGVFQALESGRFPDLGYEIAKKARQKAEKKLSKLVQTESFEANMAEQSKIYEYAPETNEKTNIKTSKRRVNLENRHAKLQKELLAAKEEMNQRALILQQELMSQGFNVNNFDVIKQLNSGEISDLDYAKASKKAFKLEKKIARTQKLRNFHSPEQSDDLDRMAIATYQQPPTLFDQVKSTISKNFNWITQERQKKALKQANIQIEGAKTLEEDIKKEIKTTRSEGGDPWELKQILRTIRNTRIELEKLSQKDVLSPKQIEQVDNLNKKIMESFQLLGKEPLGPKGTFLDKIFNWQNFGHIFEAVKGFVAFTLLGNLQYQLVDIAKNTFGAFVEFDKFKTVLEYSVGSGHKVGRSLQFVNQTVSDLKIPLKEAMQGFGKLTSSTRGNTALEGKVSEQLFTGISQASTVLGLTGEEQGGMILAISQMASKGKVMAEELRGQLAERIPGAMQIAARAMNVTTQEISKMMDNGELYADDFLPRFAKALQSQFGDAAKNASNNAQSAIFDFQNLWLKLQASIGEGLSPIVLPGVKIASEGLKLATAGAKDLGIAIAALSVGLGIKLTQALITVGSNLILQFAPGGTVVGAVTSGLQTINNSFTAKLVGGLFVALEIGKTLYDWYNTDLVKSFQKAADNAKVLREELERINKERENKSKGKETPLSKDTPDQTIADPVIRFLRGISWLKVFGVEKSWKTWGENQEDTLRNSNKDFREGQIKNLGENQKIISDIKSRKNGFENLDQINDQLKDLENRRKILNHEIEKNYRSRGLATPYEMTKQIDDLNKQITDLTEERSGIINPATKGLDTVEKQIEAVKSKIQELKSPEHLKSLSEEGRKEAEDEVTRNEKVLEDLKKQKSEFEKALSKPNPLLEVFRTLQIINIELQKAQELARKWAINEKLSTVENQFKNIRTDYFGNENASIQNATTERDKSIKDLEALKAQSEAAKKLFSTKDGEAILAEMGLDINSTLADIERANQLIGNEEGSQTKKQVLEQFKAIKQGEEQILEMRSDVAQKEITLLQAKEQRKLSIIQKTQQDAESNLKLNTNKELVEIKKLQSSKQIEEENAGLKLAEIQRNNITEQEKNLKEQLESIEEARQEGELTAKTYEDKKREINQQLSDMSVQVADQEIAVEQAKRQKLLTELEYQRKIRENALTVKTSGTTLQIKTDLSEGKISDKESSALIAKNQLNQSEEQTKETLTKIKELEDLKNKNVYTDKEFAKEKMQLQEQLLQQQTQEKDNLIQYRQAQREAIKDIIEYQSEIKKLTSQIESNKQVKTLKEGVLSGKYFDKQVAVQEAKLSITTGNIDLAKLQSDLKGVEELKAKELITERDYKLEVLKITQQIGQQENTNIDNSIKLREARKAEIQDAINYQAETQKLTAQTELNKQLVPAKKGLLTGQFTDKQVAVIESEINITTGQIELNKLKADLEGINILKKEGLISERDYKLELLKITQQIGQQEVTQIDNLIKKREARKAEIQDAISYQAETQKLTAQTELNKQLKPIKQGLLTGQYTEKQVATAESSINIINGQIDLNKAKTDLVGLNQLKSEGLISERDYKLEILKITAQINQLENSQIDLQLKKREARKTEIQEAIDYDNEVMQAFAQIELNKRTKPIKEGLLTGKFTDKQTAAQEANNAVIQSQIDLEKIKLNLDGLNKKKKEGVITDREYDLEILKIRQQIGQAENNIVDAKLKQRQARKDEVQDAIDYRMEMRKLAAQIELNKKLTPIKQGILTGKYTDKQAAALESNNAVTQSQIDLAKAKADLAGLNQLKKEGLISTRQYQLESRKITLQIEQAENNIVDAKLKQRQARKDEIQDAIDYKNELRQLASYNKIAPQLLSVKQGILLGKFNEKSASYQEAKIALTTGKNDLIKLQNELKGIEFMYQQRWITPRDYTLASGRKNKEITQQKVTNVDNAIRAKQTYVDMRLGAIDLTQQEQEYTTDKKISSQLTPLREKRLRGEVEQYDIDIITAKGELEKANNQLTKIIPARRKEINQLIKDRYLNSTQGREKLLQLNKEELSQEKTAFDQRKQMAETQINARKAKIDREINLEKYGNEQRNFEVQKRLKLAQLAGKSFEREIKINDIKLGMQSNLLDISNLYKQFNFVSTQSGLTKGERAEKQAEIGRQIMEKQKAYMEGQLQLQDENRTAINELVDIQLRGYQRVNEVKSNSLEIQSKEIENTLKLSDINKQLVDSQYNYNKAIQDISLQKSENQLEKFKLGTDLFGKILGDENFTNNANFSGKMAAVYAEYKSVINKQLRDKLKGIISLDEVFSAKGEKERQLGLEMRILDFRFNAENTIASQKLTALQSEQKYQQVLLQIDLQRTELQSKQAKYSAQKAELDAQNAVYSAKAELDKITNTKYQSEEAKTSAINDAKQKLDFAEQGLKIAKESSDIAKNALDSQSKLSGLAKDLQNAQQEGALAQFNASEDARKQANELEKAQKSWDIMSQNQQKAGSNSTSTNNPTDKNLQSLSQPQSLKVWGGNLAYNPQTFLFQLQNLSGNVERLASRPSTLIVQSTNPVQDSATIYQNIGRNTVRSAGL